MAKKKSKYKPQSPFGPGWRYVTSAMRGINGEQFCHQLWLERKTGKLKWYKPI